MVTRIRRATRVPFDEPVRYLVAGRQYQDPALNISVSGIFIATDAQHPVDSEVQMQFELPVGQCRHPVSVGGKIYRSASGDDRPAGLGITFLGLDPHSRSLICGLIRERASAGARQTAPDAAPPGSMALGPRSPYAWERALPFLLLAMLLGVMLLAVLSLGI
jgi:hypothetical protein